MLCTDARVTIFGVQLNHGFFGLWFMVTNDGRNKLSEARSHRAFNLRRLAGRIRWKAEAEVTLYMARLSVAITEMDDSRHDLRCLRITITHAYVGLRLRLIEFS